MVQGTAERFQKCMLTVGRGPVEASVAFLVCRVVGYIAHWAEGDPPRVQVTAGRALRAASVILDGLGASLEEVA